MSLVGSQPPGELKRELGSVSMLLAGINKWLCPDGLFQGKTCHDGGE